MQRPLLVALSVTLMVALGFAAYILGVRVRGESELRGTELNEPPPVGDIVLAGRGGEEVSLADYSGRYLVVFFGFSNCPDVCPLTMARLGSIYRALDEPEEVQVVMITVDPERDTPDVIDQYAKGFHPDFTGLGGSQAQVEAAARRFYISHNAAGDGEVVHGSQVLLVDRRSRFWRVYNDAAIVYLEGDLRTLL